MSDDRERRIHLITPTGEPIAWVMLPEDAPRHQPFVVEWNARLFARCRDNLYMEVARVVSPTPPSGGWQ